MKHVYAVEDCASGLYDVVIVDSPSNQMSLVRFRAWTFHTILHQPSATGEVPINVGDSSIYSLVYML